MLGHLTSITSARCVRDFCAALSQTKRFISFRPDESLRRFITQNTETVGEQSLTPEIKLRLFTPNCRFWREKPELWPFADPYWAIYWPGGQALSRFLLDNPGVCQGKKVLDLGSGCGASAIAAKLSGAAHVVANDIDTVAAVVTHINSELNGLEPPICVTENMIDSEPEDFDLILLGDMFYDEVLATTLHSWLDRCIKAHNTEVLIGDPGRAQLEGHDIRRHLNQRAKFELPASVREENYGLTCCSVWSYHPEL
ncbi:electron transfer flavoprotein beta subunit lysine methyltransferase isoform X3 [Cynoglossus semilaevis]|uniref:Electron transfer flavoprotein beta subunit lysine methyltransferase n=1 Tax=Cynoglossus semilaevis TaxID=244447 RepID=A0A3P8WIK1_CYNSE|nr:electron transfer flavoprotein beta subunit lysine methyltransferase isoform X3 [Cynoglossus semilaevis]